MSSDLRDDYRLYIDGEWRTTPESRAVRDPSTNEILVEVPEGDAALTAQAIAAARHAQPAWARLSPLARADYMKRVASLIRRDAERLARIISLEQGKPIKEARGEVGGTAGFFDYFAEFARRIQGEILPSDHPGEQIWIQRVPIGVIGAIIPWNYPSALVARKVAPSMIAGNTVVLKPHELTPLSALELAHLFDEAGIPKGVINIVTGAGQVVGEAISASPEIALITMTGSVRAGKAIAGRAATNLTPISLELGGKAPFIVMDDADLDLAVRSAATSRYMNCGQVCICNERTLVHESVYQRFVDKFVAFSALLHIGMPLDETTDIGPKISPAELAKVERMVDEAVAGGARIALGGGRPARPPTPNGNWYAPVVLTDVRRDAPIMHQEVFGPVVPIVPFTSFGEAIVIANQSDYGLSAYLFTNRMDDIMQAVSEISFGEVYVNRIGPEALQGYHTGYRYSGPGGDDGIHGLDTYLAKKTVYMNYSGRMTAPLMPY